MRTKLVEAASEQADETDHTVSRNKAEHKEKPLEKSATVKEVTRIIENLEMNALIIELRKDWANSEFLKLVNNPEFMKALEKICMELTGKYQTSPSYSWEDLRQDVIERVVKALPLFRYESSLTSWLYGIAFNRLVDVHRKPANKSFSLEGTKLPGRNGEEYPLDGEEFEGGELAARYGETYRNHEEEKQGRSILVNELMAKLSAEDRSVCLKYHVERLTMDQIADHYGISKQAVSARLSRATAKLRKYLS